MEWKASQSLASPVLHSSTAISPSSPLSISVSCGSNFKSLFFMLILTVGRWSIRARCLLHPPPPPSLVEFTKRCCLTLKSVTSCAVKKRLIGRKDASKL